MSEVTLPTAYPRFKYDDYIASPEWARKRDAAIKRANGCCQLCRSTKKIRVHHNTYERLGRELDSDIVVLCERCHNVFHVHRDERTAPKMRKRGIKAPKRVAALPAPPKIIDVSKNPIHQPGMITVTVTPEFRDSLIGHCGGITRRSLKMLGETEGWKSGWKKRCIGNVVTISEKELFVEQEIVRAKREAPPRSHRQVIAYAPPPAKPSLPPLPPKRGHDRPFTPTEVQDIRLSSFRGETYKQLANKYRCERELIGRVVRGENFSTLQWSA